MANTKLPTRDKKENNDDKQKLQMLQKQLRSWISFWVVSLIGVWLFQQFILTPLLIHETQIPYSEFKSKIATGEIVETTLGQERIEGR